MKNFNALSFGSLLLGCALAAGCAGKNSGGGTVAGADENTDSNEASASGAQASRLDQMIFSPVASADPAAAANSLATASEWWPAGCATRAKDATNPAVVHVTLKECTGPFGLEHWSGDITVTFSKGSAGLHAQATSTGMTESGRSVSWSRDADISVAGSVRTVQGNAAWTRLDARGDTVSHTSNFVTEIDIGSGCRTSNGSGTTFVGGREIDMTATDYKICRSADGTDGCPSGTLVYVHKTRGKTLTVSFNGTPSAVLTGDKGGSVTVPLVCKG